MIYQSLKEAKKKSEKLFTILVDPDKYSENSLLDLVSLANKSNVHYFFVGGSLMTSDLFEKTISLLKSSSDIPVVIFPGSNVQLSEKADALLLLSLISGRNPEYLIGQHVVAAPYIKAAGIEVLPTGYMLIGNMMNTTANYMSNTFPIPANKSEIAVCTAMAAEMLGMKLIYMDGGSGAGELISEEMIKSVKSAVQLPLIVGGGISSPEQAGKLWSAGVDMIVVGNAIEKNITLVTTISEALKKVY